MSSIKIKFCSSSKGIKISTKKATLAQIKHCFDQFIIQPKKTKTYTLKK